MDKFNINDLKKLYIPRADSHKGQNGKLMIIGGSHLFHSASLWALKVASRIVDMVFYSSVPENNEIVNKEKEEFRDGIIVPREQIEDYINEADCVLIGPGMIRAEHEEVSSIKYQVSSIGDIQQIENEGVQTYFLTRYLLQKYADKKWVIDAGALQMMEPDWLKPLKGNVVITPHRKEFDTLKFKIPNAKVKSEIQNSKLEEQVQIFTKEFNCVTLLKGEKDIVCSPEKCIEVKGGNIGMTKGGTGDVLAGLVAALSCKNDLFLAAICASFINKKAGDQLYENVGPFFNASDLTEEIPKTMKKLILP